MNYSVHFAEHQRLSLLRQLAESPAYSANDSILQDQLAAFSLHASRDQVRGHLEWLQEQGLVTVEKLGTNTMVATITARGNDVANGVVTISGVKRPAPK